ncbi:MAG TPA: LuxR C-terminal-related transcriptional regulator [Acidimicrobiales bacterium]|nr:LuxR C-terminal-related transcriptional regulator [Acidimicrobiales bacterium]
MAVRCDDLPGAWRPPVDAREQERVLRAVIDTVPAVLSYWTSDLRNVTANAAHQEWFGIDPDELSGVHLRDVLGSELFEQLRPLFTAVLAGVPQYFERTVPRLSGPAPAKVAIVPDTVGGRVIGFSVFLTDVSVAPRSTGAVGGAAGPQAAEQPVRVLVVDGDTLARTGLRAILGAANDIDVVGDAATTEEALAAAWDTRPDVIVMDLRTRGLDGFLASRRALVADGSAFPKVLVLTMSAFDEFLFDPLGEGACAVLSKAAPREALIDGVRAAARGGAARASSGPAPAAVFARAPWRPTPREREVLELAVRGFSNPEIARRLYVSIDTVKTHLRHLYDKLGVRDRQQLIATGYELGRQ